MAVNGPAEHVPEVIEFKPVGDHQGVSSGAPYLVGGFDLVADAMRTWRLDPDRGIVGVPVDRDISEMLVDAGYDRERALRVTASAVVAVTVFEIDERFKERKNVWDAL